MIKRLCLLILTSFLTVALAETKFYDRFKRGLTDLGDGLATLVETAFTVGTVLNDAVEEDCEFTCPKGEQMQFNVKTQQLLY
jgi:hypothetical protein